MKKCEGPASAEVGTKAIYKVTELSRIATEEETKKINWIVKVGDHVHNDVKNVGTTFELDVPGTHAGDILSVHPYMNSPSNEIKVQTKVGPFLRFDGSMLALFDKEHTKTAEWPGVSGEGDETNPKQPKGPIPEGRWMVRQNEIQKLPGMFSGEPNWEGGEATWGKERVQIYAYGAQAHGRARFYIHGGKNAGSKFGIDLTDKIEEFLEELRKQAKDIVLVVKLEKKAQPPNPANDANEDDRYNIEKAVKHIRENAGKTSTGACAKFVRLAILAGGIDINPNPVPAKEYGPYLIKYGFKEILGESYDLAKDPLRGDIAVIQSYPGARTQHGHITMYTGKEWASDFIQNDMWSGPGYRTNKPAFNIYRWEIKK